MRDRADHDALIPWPQQFGIGLIQRSDRHAGKHFGCGCRTVEQLQRWFTAAEYETLARFGYQAVRFEVDRVLAESDIQLVFQRARPLRFGAEPFDLYAKGTA